MKGAEGEEMVGKGKGEGGRPGYLSRGPEFLVTPLGQSEASTSQHVTLYCTQNTVNDTFWKVS